MALSFLKTWFSKTSLFESLARWQDSPLRKGTFGRKRLARRRKLSLETLEDRTVPAFTTLPDAAFGPVCPIRNVVHLLAGNRWGNCPPPVLKIPTLFERESDGRTGHLAF